MADDEPVVFHMLKAPLELPYFQAHQAMIFEALGLRPKVSFAAWLERIAEMKREDMGEKS